MKSQQVIFVSHGGGPLPLLGDPQHQELTMQLQQLGSRIAKPSAIVVISAHWEALQPTVTSAAQPALLYDYYGFPPESYQLTYPAPGHPQPAQQIVTSLHKHCNTATQDAQRGLDHGVFVPLKWMFPTAAIPVVQLSLKANLDPQQHIDLGQALADLEYENLLILGSGFSFHNMRAFFAPQTEATERRNQAFENWLKVTLTDTQLNESERQQRLIQWEQAPEARFCHPREEHLLPLLVCYGATRRAADSYQMARTLGRTAGMFIWSKR